LDLQSNGKKLSAQQKKTKIDLWEITGCAKVQEIERPVYVFQGRIQGAQAARTPLFAKIFE
jgi:hypothetical protein